MGSGAFEVDFDTTMSCGNDASEAGALLALINSTERDFEHDGGRGAENGGHEQMVDLGDQSVRTSRLQPGLDGVVKLDWEREGESETERVVERLGDLGRNVNWRIPLGESGTLDFFLQLLSSHTLRPRIKVHILRLIGNSCADRDANRARVLSSNHLPTIISQLSESSLMAFVIPVLYNVCKDYEPAQKQASECGLSKKLVALVSSKSFNESRALLGHVCKILELLAVQSCELNNAMDSTPFVLMQLATSRENPTDLEDFIALTSTVIAYMQHEKFQKAVLAEHSGLDTSLKVLVDSYSRFDLVGQDQANDDGVEQLSHLRREFIKVLSDVSAAPEFKATCPINSPLTSSLRGWLSSPHVQLQICACIMLGNLARSDEACIQFIQSLQVQKPLLTILSTNNDTQLLHACLGFLKNLALPKQNKSILGKTEIFDILVRLWTLDTLPPIQLSSVSLTRQLLITHLSNALTICNRADPASKCTKLSLLIALFDRTDTEPIKVEISRLIAAICRSFETTKDFDPEDVVHRRRDFFGLHPEISRALSFMVSQSKWPILRSEGWFVFAMASRYPEGLQCIFDLIQDAAVFRPLVELLTGKSIMDFRPAANASGVLVFSDNVGIWEAPTPASFSTPLGLGDTLEARNSQCQGREAEWARVDRENVLVLVTKLLDSHGQKMVPKQRRLFEDILKAGGEMLVTGQERNVGVVAGHKD